MATIEVATPKDATPVFTEPAPVLTPAPAPAPAASAAPSPAPVREDQVANAVAFLTNPKVRAALKVTLLLALLQQGVLSQLHRSLSHVWFMGAGLAAQSSRLAQYRAARSRSERPPARTTHR